MTRGTTYRIKYRVLNGIDWSSFSPILNALAANAPNAPPLPQLVSADVNEITLSFGESSDSGGSQVTKYELWMDQGVQGTEFLKVDSYSDNGRQHTLTTDTDGIVSGTTYTFKYRSANIIGDSVFSNEVRYAISSPPAKPNTPTKDYDRSGRTFMMIQWSESAATEIPIIGYTLYMSKGTGEYEMIYEDAQNALQREFEVKGLETGQLYQFKVAAINFNGKSVLSDALEVYSCDFPGQPDKPYRVTGTKEAITLGWAPPAENGGCPITSYYLYRDDGEAGTISIEVDAADINNRPTLTQHEVVLTATDTGKQFRFKLVAENFEGVTESRVAAFIIAQEPDKPASAPTHDPANSD